MNARAIIPRFLAFTVCFSTYLNLSAQGDRGREMQIHYDRAQQALKAKKPEVAAHEFQELLQLEPNNAMVRANLGLIAFDQADYVRATEDFRAAVKLQPELWNAQAFLGMSELRLGHSAEAKPILEKCFSHLQDAKLRAQVGADLVSTYYQANDLNDAVDTLRVLQRTNPDDPDILYNAYRTYSDLAAHALSALARVAPESARMHEILAQTLMSQDDFPGAIAQYRAALKTDPRLPGIHFELGQAILANSHEEPARQEAKKEFETDLAANPVDANAEYELGEIYWLRSNLQAAFGHYSRALELQGDLVDAKIALGKVLTAMRQPEKAVGHLLEAVRLDPQNEVTHYRLALAYRKLGRTEDADREWATCQKLRDSHTSVRSLYQQVQQRPAGTQSVESSDLH